MPRRKVKHISATELACFEQIVAELKARGDFERHIAINCKEPFDYIVGISKLAKVAKISRPTMTRWCSDKFIRPETEQVKFASEQDEIYDLGVVLKQLRAIK